MPSSRGRTSNTSTETSPRNFFYDKAKLLRRDGDRWDREIAKNLELDAPYR